METGGAEAAGDGAGAAGRRVQDTVDKNGYRRRKRWQMNGQDRAQPMKELKKNERYMEGNYDNSGNIVKRYKQKADDEHRSLQIAEEIKASQEAVYERETESLSYDYQAVGEAFTKLLKAYIEEDKYQQYLVDGAVLRCNQATTEDFDYNGGTVVLENKADEVCNIVLDVHENPISGGTASDNTMTINGHRYATVTDTLQGFNINPPKCNCRLAADRISEHEKIRADGDRNKNGVCTHLMWLNREWDNYRVEGTEYLKKDDAIMVFDTGKDGQAVQVDSVIEHRGVEGITMTSVLFCKHGGLIMPVTSGQTVVVPAKEERFQFTKEQLIACGWENVTDGELEKLNKALIDFKVVSAESAFMMFATMLSESGCENALEGQPRINEFDDLSWEKYKAELRANGNVVGDYGWKERGAGYIQLTGETVQRAFLERMEDPYNGDRPAEYIGMKYPIEAAVYYWSEVDKTSKGNLNAYIEEYGATEGTFLITQYFTNGYKEGIDESLRNIRDGKSFPTKIETGKLTVDGKRFDHPNGWKEREEIWEKVNEELQKYE